MSLSTIKLSRSPLLLILLVLILVVSNILLTSSIRSTLEFGWHLSDYVNHISAAQSFLDGKNFELNYSVQNVLLPLEQILNEVDPEISEPYTRGILFYILLGSFYYVMNTSPPDFLLHASYFSTLLSSIFLVSFFFLIRKYFDLKIAFFSSLLILFNPTFVTSSISTELYFPSLIFGVTALFFLKRNNLHYVAFGIFTGLAHLGHQAGILLGFSYVVFLLINKEFKGALITFLSWNAVLIPHFVRNYYIWKDFGVGFNLPYSGVISQYLWFLPTKTSTAISNRLLPTDSQWFTNRINVDFFDLLERSLNANGLSQTSIIVYLSIFAIFVFIGVKTILNKNNTRRLSIFFHNANFSRFTFFISVFLIITLISALGLSYVYQFTKIPSKYFLFSIFLFFPVMLFGLSNFASLLFEKITYIKKSHLQIIIFIIIVLLVTTQSVQGLLSVTKPPDGHPVWDTVWSPNYVHGIDQMSTWIYANIPNDAVISSATPSDVYIRTGLTGIGLPSNLDCTNLSSYLNYFNPSYFVWYYNPFEHRNIAQIPSGDYSFSTLYVDNSWNYDFIVYEIQKNSLFEENGLQLFIDQNTDDENLIHVIIDKIDLSINAYLCSNNIQGAFNIFNMTDIAISDNSDIFSVSEKKIFYNHMLTYPDFFLFSYPTLLHLKAEKQIDDKNYLSALHSIHEIQQSKTVKDFENLDDMLEKVESITMSRFGLVSNSFDDPNILSILNDKLHILATFKQIYSGSENTNSLNICNDCPDGEAIGIEIDVDDVGSKINSVTMYLITTGSPTGTFTVGVWDSSDVAKSVYTADASTITSDADNIFDFPIVTLATGDKIIINYDGGDTSNAIAVRGANGIETYGTVYMKYPTWNSDVIAFQLDWTITEPSSVIEKLSALSLLLDLKHAATSLENEEKFNESLQLYDQMLSIEPFSLDALYGKIDISFKLEQEENQSQLISQTVGIFNELRDSCIPDYLGNCDKNKLNQEYLKFIKDIGQKYDDIGEENKAKSIWDEVYSIDRFDLEMMMRNAQYFEKEGNYQAAINAYERILQMHPQLEDVIQEKLDELISK